MLGHPQHGLFRHDEMSKDFLRSYLELWRCRMHQKIHQHRLASAYSAIHVQSLRFWCFWLLRLGIWQEAADAWPPASDYPAQSSFHWVHFRDTCIKGGQKATAWPSIFPPKPSLLGCCQDVECDNVRSLHFLTLQKVFLQVWGAFLSTPRSGLRTQESSQINIDHLFCSVAILSQITLSTPYTSKPAYSLWYFDRPVHLLENTFACTWEFNTASGVESKKCRMCQWQDDSPCTSIFRTPSMVYHCEATSALALVNLLEVLK